MTPQQGSVLSQYYNSQRQGKRIPGYQGNVNDMRTTAPDGRSAYVDDYGDMYYMDTGERVETRAIPEDLSQPMVGPDSAYGPYYELGPFGPYDTRDINDSRHPDNPNNRPQADTGAGGYQAPTQAEMREMAQQAQALREANDARTAEAEAELAPEPDYYDRATGLPSEKEMMRLQREFELREANEARTREAEAELAAEDGISIQGGFDQYGNLYGSEPYHYGRGPKPDQVKPLPQVDITPYPQVAPDEPRPQVAPDEPSPFPYGYGLGDLEDQIGYDPRPRPLPEVDITPYPPVAPELSIPNPQPDPYLGPRERPLPQLGTPPSAGYLRSTGEGGAGLNSYYDEINAYLANHSQDEVQQAMGTYGVSQEDVDAARAYQQPQYARGGLSRMLRKVNRKVR